MNYHFLFGIPPPQYTFSTYIHCKFNSMLHFAIAEDLEYDRNRLKAELSYFRNHQLTICANNGFELLIALKNVKRLPDFLLLDIQMPKIDGLILTQYITLRYPTIKIIGISSHSNEALVTEVLSEGAIGFITKYFLAKESIVYLNVHGKKNIFFEALEAALLNELYIDCLLFNKTKEIKRSKSTKEIIREKFGNLTDLQIEYLILNAADLTHKEIAQILNKSPASIKHYYNCISSQFNITSRSGLVYFCTTNGIVKHPRFYDENAN